MTSEQDNGGMELGRFLRACRAKVTPAEVGLPAGAGRRRTPGLRREELAWLAGVSIDYYTRLEQGKKARPSPSVVGALARALRLDEADRERLRALAAGTARHVPEGRTAVERRVRPGTVLLLNSLRPNPAHLLDQGMTLLAWNPGGLRMYPGIEDWPVEHRNVARYVLLHPAARTLLDDWEDQVRCCVAYLRASVERDPGTPALIGLVRELVLESPEFARLWKRQDVQGHPHGRRVLHHPDVGTITLRFQVMHLVGARGWRTVTYYADPGTADHDGMVMLDMAADDHAAHPTEPPG
ncbi:helix-turn-helix transcriptional regulator [Saccharothrix sp.]|uniref:helix-turn-helix transcriptional regulator n=1 Tax=Saccharothrix sp. TaxID=1873460 RepID=UPI0028117DC4|nr:helix-turn-helix transcriptional regulator [Saccharothrix sp.]